MLHLRLTSPPGLTDQVVATLNGCPGLASLAVIRDASLRPPGDLVLADVARESVDEMVTAMRALGLDDKGSITLTVLDAAVSKAAEQAEEAAPGEGADAVIWEEVVRRTYEDSTLSKAFVIFLTLAASLAAIAVVLDSAILVVGAMVVGPEFGALAGLAVGLVHRRRHLLERSIVTLLVGFATAIAVVTMLCLLARGVGWIDATALTQPRPLTGFIWTPDRWSFVVAFIAGVAGVLALTSDKSGSLVGVFISVSTVPATGNLALALALGHWAEVGGSAGQLAINVSAILLAGVLTLLTQTFLQDLGRRRARARRRSRQTR